MTRRVWAVLCMALAAFLAGCGGGGGGGDSSVEQADVKGVMSELLVAATKGLDALPSVRDKLDAKDFETAIRQSASATRWEDVPAEKKAEAERGCFSQLLAVPRETVLGDRTAIDAALAAGKITILTQTRSAYVEFQGNRAEGKGAPIKFKAKLNKGADGNWRLVTCELA